MIIKNIIKEQRNGNFIFVKIELENMISRYNKFIYGINADIENRHIKNLYYVSYDGCFAGFLTYEDEEEMKRYLESKGLI